MSELKPSIISCPKKNNLPSDTFRNFITNLSPYVSDHGRSSIVLNELERQSTESRQSFTNVNMQNSATPMNPFDKPRITVKQTLVGLNDDNRNLKPWVVSGPENTGLTNWKPKFTQKESTIDNNYIGTINKNEGMGYDIANYKAPITIKQTTLNENYLNNAYYYVNKPEDYLGYLDPQKVRYSTHALDYLGGGNYKVNQSENRTQWDNADITETKSALCDKEPGQFFRGADSRMGKFPIGKYQIGNVHSSDRNEYNTKYTGNIGNIQNVLLSKKQLGRQTKEQFYNRSSQIDMFNSKNPDQEFNRFDSDVITKQLSNNPWYNLKRNV